MYVKKATQGSLQASDSVSNLSRTGRYLTSPRPTAARIGLFVAGTLGVISAIVVEQRTGTADWTTSHLSRARAADPKAAPARLAFDSAATVQHIRAVLGLSVTEVGRLFGVSRQSVHEWHRGGAISPENGDKLAKLSKLADVLVEAQVAVSPYVLRRPLSSGKSLLETALSVEDVALATHKIVAVLARETRQREAMVVRLANRKPLHPDFRRYIAPHVTDIG